MVGNQLKLIAQTASQDERVGAAIAEAFDKVGKYGIVTLEGGGATAATVEVIQGIQIDRGFVTDAFVTDAGTAECRLDEPAILLSEFKIGALKDLLPLLEMIVQAGKQLLIVAEDVEGEALSTLILNQRAGRLRVCAIRAPGFGDRRRHLLEDLAILTGGIAFTATTGRAISSIQLSDLGTARSVLVNDSQTTIVEGRAKEEAVDERIRYLSAQMGRTNNPMERDKLQERLAWLAGAVAIIRTGGITPAESADRRAVFANAMHATQSAIQTGWVVGGGWAGAYAAQVIRGLEGLSKADRDAHDCVASALEAPIRYLYPGREPKKVLQEKEKITADGVLDSTGLHSQGLRIAWAHVKSIVQTGTWDVAEIPSDTDNDDE